MDTGINLDEVINSYLDAWELPDGQYRRIHGLAVRGYRQVYMHASGVPQTVQLEVLANKTSILPCDCLNKLTLGVMNAMGEISPLTEDESLGFGNTSSNNRLSEPTQPLLVEDDANIFYDASGNYLTPFVFGQFGVGAESDLGFYRIDWEQRIIVYDFNFPYSDVWLEYLPVFTDNGEYVVSPFFVEAILAFIGWQDKRRTVGDRRDSKVEYYNEMRIGKRSIRPFELAQGSLQYTKTTRQARF